VHITCQSMAFAEVVADTGYIVDGWQVADVISSLQPPKTLLSDPVTLFCRRVVRPVIICCCKTSVLACSWRIHSTKSAKLLWVVIRQDINFCQHIESVITTYNQRLYLLAQLRRQNLGVTETDNIFQAIILNTRKPSCRWQNRATLAKSLHGLRKSSGVVVSCIASLLIDSVHIMYYYVLYSNCVCKMRRFGDTRLLKLPWPWNTGQGSLKVIESDTIR